MVVATHRLLAKDGAKFHARVRQGGYNQVVLVMQVRLGDQHEPEQPQHMTDPARAREIAQQFAEEQGFDKVLWDD
jgi:hypothetical protein